MASAADDARRNPGKMVYPPNLEHNTGVVNFSRVFTSIAAGCAAGVLGFTGLYGVVFFLVSVAASSALLWAKTSGDVETFFPNTAALVTTSLFPGVMTFVLFWTLLYNMVHVY